MIFKLIGLVILFTLGIYGLIKDGKIEQNSEEIELSKAARLFLSFLISLTLIGFVGGVLICL